MIMSISNGSMIVLEEISLQGYREVTESSTWYLESLIVRPSDRP